MEWITVGISALTSLAISLLVALVNNFLANRRQLKQFENQERLQEKQFEKQVERQKEQFNKQDERNEQQNELDKNIKRYDYLFHLVTNLVNDNDKKYTSIYKNYQELLTKTTGHEKVVLIATLSSELREFYNAVYIQSFSIKNNLDDESKNNISEYEGDLINDIKGMLYKIEDIIERSITDEEISKLYDYVNPIGKSKLVFNNKIQMTLSDQLNAIYKI